MVDLVQGSISKQSHLDTQLESSTRNIEILFETSTTLAELNHLDE